MHFIIVVGLAASVGLISLLFSPFKSEFPTISPESCLALQQEPALFQALKESGLYRYTNAPGQEPQFNFSDRPPFQDYLSYSLALIQQKNPKADLPCPVETVTYQAVAKQNQWQKPATVARLVAPFELRQTHSNKAILLIHGLTDSPFLMHDLAFWFYQQGFNVRTLLLPGHGTAPSELLHTQVADWQRAVRYAIHRTEADYDEVYLGGYSMGGALILDHLMAEAELPAKLKALLLWAPASKAKSSVAGLAKYVDLIPGVDWVSQGADVDFAKYESFPFHAAAQVHQLMELVNQGFLQAGHQLQLPMFAALSAQDETIDTQTTLNWFHTRHSQATSNAIQADQLIYYGADQGINAQTAPALPASLHFSTPMCSGSSCLNTQGFSHISVTSSANNPHYGANGFYRHCEHYQGNDELFLQCKTTDDYIWGSVNAEELEHSTKPVRRLTFNPYYEQMLDELALFLGKVQRTN